MKENLVKAVSYLKVLKKLPTAVKFLFKYKVRFPIVLILLIVTFFLGSFLSNTSSLEKVDKTIVNDSKQIDDNTKVDIAEVHLANTIHVGNQQAPAPDGKKYLVIFTTVENASSSASQVNFGDWFRVNQDNKKLAPLPLNTTFVIPPKASLDKQLVFIVDQTKKSFNLLVGKLDKEPQPVNLQF